MEADQMRHAVVLAAAGLVLLAGNAPAETMCQVANLKVPPGYTVELAVASPLVKHPLMGCFDEQGRLYLAANAGRNLRRDELEKQLPNFVQRLEDTNGDGVFDRSVVFADRMTFPQGCLWYRGSLYVASSGAIWKLTDTTGDGVADERIKLVGDFGYTGNAADVHGPFLGREGRIWWCEGRHGHEFRDAEGNVTSRGKAARIFHCLPDGTDVQTWCTGGMDNPVELVFTPEGDVLGTVNLMYNQPRGDCLVHWQWGGVYPRKDFVDELGGEFYRTGELLREVHNFGHVAVSGLCRYEGSTLGEEAIGDLFITQFNTGKIIRTKLKRAGATYEIASNADFLTSECDDFHPTDVLEDADGSLLVIDTGGWFRIGCPESEVAKPEVHGAIYRIRKTDAEPVHDPRGLDIAWDELEMNRLLELLGDRRPAVRERAVEAIAQAPLDSNIGIAWLESDPLLYGTTEEDRVRSWQHLAWAVSRRRTRFSESWLTFAPVEVGNENLNVTFGSAWASLPPTLGDSDAGAFKLLAGIRRYSEQDNVVGVATRRPAEQVVRARLLANAFPEKTVEKITQACLAFDARDGDRPMAPLVRHAFLYALIKSNDREGLIRSAQSQSPTMRALASIGLEQLRRDLSSVTDDDLFAIPPPELGQPLTDDQRAKLLAIEAALPAGDAQRGRKLYVVSKQADCRKCHRIAGKGGLAGPDLTNVGARRKRRDLLESILYPSASFVRGYEPYAVITSDGKAAAGIIVGETAAAIRLAVDPEQPTEIPRNTIEEIKATNLSTMPSNVHEQLSPQELADLIAYMESLK